MTKHGAHITHTRRRWKLNPISLLPGAMALIGLTVFFYPHAAQWFTQYNQSIVVNNYQTQVIHAEPEAAIQLRQAREYNTALKSGAQLDANANIARGTGTSESILEYNKLLNVGNTGLMGRIRIPKISVDLPIYHGTADSTLLTGAGHLQGTSLPVGGESTRTVITAHRGLANAEMFTNLDKVTLNDTFSLEVFGEAFVYRVIDVKVIEPDAGHAVAFEPGKDLASLITCTPLGVNSHRILVTGERIRPTPIEEQEKVGKAADVPGFPWFIITYSVGLCVIVWFMWQMGRPTGRTSAARSAGDDTDADEAGADEAGQVGEAGADEAGNSEGSVRDV